jgi:hypothetical protein
MDDTINWEVAEKVEPQATVPPRCKRTSVQATADYILSRSSYDGKEKGSPKTEIEQLAQAPGGHAVLDATKGHGQRPKQEKVKRQG